MKKFLALFLTLAAAGIAYGAPPASLSGKWNVHSSVAGSDSDSVCTFVQTAKILTGSCTTADQGDKKITGTVEDTKISWSFDSEYSGTPLTVKFVGNLDVGAMKITGTTLVEQFGVDGNFTAVPAK